MTNGEKILKEMNEFHASATDAGDGDLPFESLEDYSLDPIGFEEAAAMVNEQVEHFFDLSVKYNHQSEKYLEICGFLERGIKYLGSACLTKTCLNYKKQVFPKLEDLSTHRLYAMVSYNLRKLNRTVSERMAASDEIPAKWLDMQFRYLNLTERLKSTESKIYHCLVWGEGDDIDKAEERERMFTEKAFNLHYVKKYVKKPVFRQASAFPVLKDAVKELQNHKAETAEAQPAETVEEQIPGTDPQPETETIPSLAIVSAEAENKTSEPEVPLIVIDEELPGEDPDVMAQMSFLISEYLRLYPELRNDPERLYRELFGGPPGFEDDDDDDDDYGDMDSWWMS